MFSANYVENYLDSVENLPDDVQRYLTRIREIDSQCKGECAVYLPCFLHQNINRFTKFHLVLFVSFSLHLVHLRDVDYYYDQWSNCSTTELESKNTTGPSKRARAMARIQQNLIAAQELGDDKMQVMTQLQEMIDQKTRQLDADFKNLEYADKDDPALIDASPKDAHPSSPSSYIPTSSNAAQRSDDGSVAGSSGTSSSLNNERQQPPGGANTSLSASGGNANVSSSSHNADRNAAKRSRRAREVAARGANNANTFSSISKTSQIDLASDSNNSNSNQSNKNTASTGQQVSVSSSSNPNRKHSGNNGGNSSNNTASNNNKKRKRKSARSNNGGNGKADGIYFLQTFWFALRHVTNTILLSIEQVAAVQII